jgi:hypothetical protein
VLTDLLAVALTYAAVALAAWPLGPPRCSATNIARSAEPARAAVRSLQLASESSDSLCSVLANASGASSRARRRSERQAGHSSLRRRRTLAVIPADHTEPPQRPTGDGRRQGELGPSYRRPAGATAPKP